MTSNETGARQNSDSERLPKAEQLLKFSEDHAFTDPEHDHSPGRCKECEEDVVIDMGLRPRGMAESCQDHLPLCQFQEGSRHV